jgi:LPS export ABC transporter protein LptC
MTNRFLHIIAFIAALTSCFFFSACENDMQEIENFSKREIGVEEGKNIVSLLSNGGIMRAKLTAPVLLRYQTQVPKVEFPKTLHVDFYDSLKNIESQLFAKYGEYKENQNLVYLRDSIVVFNIKGDTLLTNELYWDQNRHIFYNDKPTIVIQSNPRQRLYSKDGLTADQGLQWFTLKNLQPESFTVIPDSTYQ